MERERERGPFTGHFASLKPHISGFAVKEPSLKVPLMESHAERCPITEDERRTVLPPSFIYQSPRYTSPLHIPGSPRMERGLHGERCPYLENFLTYIPGSPVKEFPRVPIHGASSKGEAPSLEPLLTALKISARRALLQVPQLGPLWKEMPVSRAFFTYPSGSPARELSPSKFPSQSSHRERHSTSRAPFTIFQSLR